MARQTTSRLGSTPRKRRRPGPKPKARAVVNPTIDGTKPLDNLRHELFVHEYLRDRNGTAAYQRVYTRASYETANTEAPGLLANPRIAARLAHLAQAIVKKLGISRERTLEELAAVGFSNITDFVSISASGITIKDINESVDARAISGAEQRQTQFGTTIKINLHNKVAALHDLGEHFGLFEGNAGTQKRRPVMVMNMNGPTVVQVGVPTRPALETSPRPASSSRRRVMTLPDQPEER